MPAEPETNRVAFPGGFNLVPASSVSSWVSPGKGRPVVNQKLIRARRRATGIAANLDAAPVSFGPPVKYVEIPNGEQGTVVTLKIMKRLVLSPWGHRNPDVVRLAQKIVDHVPAKDYRGQAQALFDFMSISGQQGVVYRLDPAGLEEVASPWYTLFVSGHGDCDDAAVSMAALAMALGHRAAFRTVKGDKDRQDQWSHVYAVIGVKEPGKPLEWLSADTTQEEAHLGWDPPEGSLYGMKTWVIDPSVED